MQNTNLKHVNIESSKKIREFYNSKLTINKITD